MTEKDILNELVEILKPIANKEALADNDDFMVDDYAGGNIDDAYYHGVDDGEIYHARRMLRYLVEHKVGL